MTKSLKDLPKFYSFTDVYKGDKDDATNVVMRDRLIYYLDKLVELGVKQIVMYQTITPREEHAEVRVRIELPQELKFNVIETLEDFAWHAALTYYPEIKEEHGGQWWCVIDIHTDPELNVQVRHHCLKQIMRTEPVNSTTFEEK